MTFGSAGKIVIPNMLSSFREKDYACILYYIAEQGKLKDSYFFVSADYLMCIGMYFSDRQWSIPVVLTEAGLRSIANPCK